jgi:hypothetical protein
MNHWKNKITVQGKLSAEWARSTKSTINFGRKRMKEKVGPLQGSELGLGCIQVEGGGRDSGQPQSCPTSRMLCCARWIQRKNSFAGHAH